MRTSFDSEFRDSLNVNVEEFDVLLTKIVKLNSRAEQLTGWQNNQTEGYEDLVTSALEEQLKNGYKFIDIVSKYQKKLLEFAFEDGFFRGVEWDGIIYCSKDCLKYLSLFEVKTTITLAAIKDCCPSLYLYAVRKIYMPNLKATQKKNLKK